MKSASLSNFFDDLRNVFVCTVTHVYCFDSNYLRNDYSYGITAPARESYSTVQHIHYATHIPVMALLHLLGKATLLCNTYTTLHIYLLCALHTTHFKESTHNGGLVQHKGPLHISKDLLTMEASSNTRVHYTFQRIYSQWRPRRTHGSTTETCIK